MLAILALVIILVVVFRATDPDTRTQLGHAVRASVIQAVHEARRPRPELERFREALRARTRWVVVTPVLVALIVTVFVLMLRDSGGLVEHQAVARWGGNFWLRTRNGEWWRLVTSVFVHTGALQVLVNVIALVPIGVIAERLIGRLSVAVVFLTAGIFASLVNLVTHPMATGVGASGAIFGLYGLLAASSIVVMRRPSDLTIPLRAVKRLMPAAAVFVLFNLLNDSLGSAAELTGLLAGLVCGALLARGVGDRKPAARRTGYALAATMVIVVLSALPLRGITDVKPELERTIAAEDRTAARYQQAAEQFRRRRITADDLALLIDRTIIPELGVTGARLKALEAVPREHEPLVADAEEYVRLRSASWRLRAAWLRKSGRVPSRGNESAQYRADNRTVAQAEETERAALDVLERIKPAVAATP